MKKCKSVDQFRVRPFSLWLPRTHQPVLQGTEELSACLEVRVLVNPAHSRPHADSPPSISSHSLMATVVFRMMLIILKDLPSPQRPWRSCWMCILITYAKLVVYFFSVGPALSFVLILWGLWLKTATVTQNTQQKGHSVVNNTHDNTPNSGRKLLAETVCSIQ